MIHISQEELFRKIEQAHEQQPQPQSQSQSQSQHHQHKSTRREAEETLEKFAPICELSSREVELGGAGSLARLSAECCTSHSRLPGPELGGRRSSGEHEQMSAILTPGYATKSIPSDRNNNNTNQTTTTSSSAVAAQQSPDEDEVQAVLITGCGSKIGSNIAAAFAVRGLKVALVDFDIRQTEVVAKECQHKSPKNRVPLQIVADISQLAEAHKVIDRTIEAFGRLDVLVNTVNNASLMEAKFNASGDDDPHVFEQYHKIIANNMHAVTYLCISAAPYLRKTKGSIVNVSSITNNETGSYKFAYCMSKAGISTLTKCLATDLAPDIKVICVSPKSDA